MVAKLDKKERKTDIYIHSAYKRTDSLTYILPDGYELSESVKVRHKSEFGNISNLIHAEGNKVYLYTSCCMNKGRYPKEKFNDFKEFITIINKIESYELIINQKN
jgi:hypothetical protein